VISVFANPDYSCYIGSVWVRHDKDICRLDGLCGCLTLKEMKEMIQDKLSIPVDEQCLVFDGGRMSRDDSTLGCYTLPQDRIIDVVRVFMRRDADRNATLYKYAGSAPKLCVSDDDVMSGIGEIAPNCFRWCTLLQEVILSKALFLRKIGSGAFARSGLRKICFPAGLVEIEDYCFEGCRHLSTIIFEGPSNLKQVGRRAFTGTAVSTILLAPEDRERLCRLLFRGTCLPRNVKIIEREYPDDSSDLRTESSNSAADTSNNPGQIIG
jgi:hypothetical protein